LAKLYKAKQTYGVSPSENPKHAMADIRWQRIVHNDMENIFMGLIVAWGSLFSAANASVHCVCVVIFTVSRILHTLSYAYELQPHRGIAWFVAVIAVLVIAVNGVIGVL
jgi:glutathione S-transferase